MLVSLKFRNFKLSLILYHKILVEFSDIVLSETFQLAVLHSRHWHWFQLVKGILPHKQCSAHFSISCSTNLRRASCQVYWCTLFSIFKITIESFWSLHNGFQVFKLHLETRSVLCLFANVLLIPPFFFFFFFSLSVLLFIFHIYILFGCFPNLAFWNKINKCILDYCETPFTLLIYARVKIGVVLFLS